MNQYNMNIEEEREYNEQLKMKIAAYWRKEGFEAPVFTEEYASKYHHNKGALCIRSDMKHGFPQRRL